MDPRAGEHGALGRALLAALSITVFLAGGTAWTALRGERGAAGLAPGGIRRDGRRSGERRIPRAGAPGCGSRVEVHVGDEDFGRSVLHSLDAHIAVLDHRGRIVEVNTAWNEFALRNGGDLARCGVGVDYLDVCRRARGPGEDDARAVLAGLESMLAGRSGELEREYACPSPEVDGWYLLRATPLGAGGGLVVSHIDITALKRAQATLRFLGDAGAELASTLDYQDCVERVTRLAVPRLADACVVAVYEDGGFPTHTVVAAADPAVAAQLREMIRRIPLTRRREAGLPPARLVEDPLVLAEVTDADLRGMAMDASHLAQLRSLRLRSAMVAPLVAHDRRLGLAFFGTTSSGRRYEDSDLEVALDLARRAATAIDNARLYRQVRLADQRKDELLAMLAHELRNPLAPIRTAAELLRRRAGADPALRATAATIERQVERQARLIADLLNVTRLARGRIGLQTRRLDLAALVRDSVGDHRRSIEDAGLELDVEVPEEPAFVEGDPTRLAQVLDNLVHNAVKFTDPGGRILVWLRRDEGERRVRVGVRDTGIGIESTLLPEVFTTFTQADRSLDRSRGGLGLGLALVKGMVELHGGWVGASSEGLGKGAEFTFGLPLAEAPRARAAAEEEPLPGPSPPRRVLVVEDQADAAYTLRTLLELDGHRVEVAHTGPEGVEAARRFRPDVVLCDIGLPGMDGYAVARALRRDPACAGMKLVAVSGYGQEEDRRRSREVGFDEHLTKPVDPADLERSLALPRGS
ncbi:ATP-binding protein [Myxococcota bacterium]|nr:ATP-binding protein [Myxococcota bacterium]